MTRLPPTGELPQRQLALELRYAIDVARERPSGAAFDRVKALVDRHPHGMTSRHVEHNLGLTRNEWLRRNELLK